jgi:hypothetical protein
MGVSWDTYNEIHDLLVAVHTHFNAGEFDEMGKIFQNAKLITAYTWSEQALVAEGGERIGEGYRRATRLHGGMPRVQYWLSNVVIRADEDAGTAQSSSQYAALIGDETTWGKPHGMEPEDHAKPPIQIFSVGRYEDKFARVDGRWEFTERMIYADLTGDRSLHLKTDPMKNRDVNDVASRPAGYS